MKPAWDSLAQSYKSSDKVVIADVDCTADNAKALCERFGVEGFPTIKYFNPPDEEGEDYSGGRDLDALKAFAATLGPGCSAAMLDKCTDEEKVELEEVMALPEEERMKQIEGLKAKIKAKEAEHEKFVEGLQAQYETSQKGVETLKKEVAPKMKLLKAAAAPKPAATAKDEV